MPTISGFGLSLYIACLIVVAAYLRQVPALQLVLQFASDCCSPAQHLGFQNSLNIIDYRLKRRDPCPIRIPL